MTNWKQKAIQMAESDKALSWRSIARDIGKSKSTVSDTLRKHFHGYVKPNDVTYTPDNVRVSIGGVEIKRFSSGEDIVIDKPAKKVTEAEKDNSVILLISDMHIPYHHKDLIPFLTHLKDKYKPTRVICMGDELDKNSLSYHENDPDLPNAGQELLNSLPTIKEVHNLFPIMDIIESNHGSLVWRKAKTHGIPRHYIKSYNDVLGVDDGWQWHFDLTITLPNGQPCYFHHGKTNNVLRLSQQMGMCAVQGHYHEILGASYWSNPTGLFWGLQVGCMIDDNSYAFAYNNVNIKRPVIGTALIVNGLPVLEPMVLDKQGRWVGY